MGDLIAVINHLDLSPINTILLAVLLFILFRVFDKVSTRVAALEHQNAKQGRSLAFIKGRLGLIEDEDN